MIRGNLNIRYPVHGTGHVKAQTMGRARGGIFGGPVMPAGRTGNFREQWALPLEMAHSDTGVFEPYTHARIPGSGIEESLIVTNTGMGGPAELWNSMTTREKVAWGFAILFGLKAFGLLP
jgi:hypothetical protein